MKWLNEPAHWTDEGERVVIVTDANTDFWQKTHYGFSADNGHFFYRETTGDCALSARVCFHPQAQYDQAGLMLRFSADCWVKTSVEHELEGAPKLGVVVTTLGFSDWSIQDYAGPNEIWLRIRRAGNDCFVEWSHDGAHWREMRVAHLHGATPLAMFGVYTCSPKSAGFRAEFDHLVVEECSSIRSGTSGG